MLKSVGNEEQKAREEAQLEAAVHTFQAKMNTFERDLIIAMVAMCGLAFVLIAIFFRRK